MGSPHSAMPLLHPPSRYATFPQRHSEGPLNGPGREEAQLSAPQMLFTALLTDAAAAAPQPITPLLPGASSRPLTRHGSRSFLTLSANLVNGVNLPERNRYWT
jgi:hypothetical protein